MRRPLAPASLGDGGYAFAPDPYAPVGTGPVSWLPEFSPGTLIIDVAPSSFDPLSLDPAQLGSVIADRIDDDGREVVVADGTGELHIRLCNDRAVSRPAIILPIGATAIDLRLDVASRFVRRLRGQTIGLLPQALRLTVLRKRRLIQLLQAYDIHETGGGPRDVAETVLRSEQAGLPSVEWKDSHSRRAANRLIHDAISLVQRGYLKFLRGD